MSNFLSNLIARAAQRAPVLERRQNALFEPVTPWTGPVPTTIDQAVDLPVEESTFTGPQPSRALAGDVPGEQPDTLTSLVPEIPVRRIPERKDSKSSPRPAALRAADAPTFEAASPVSTTTAWKIASTEPAFDVGAEDHVVYSPRPVPPKIDALSGQSSMAGTTSIAPQTQPIYVPENRPRQRQDTSRAEAVRPSSPIMQARKTSDAAKNLLAPAAPRITQAVQLVKATQSARGNHFSATTNSESTSVQVTIGRVEVRAVTSTERPAAHTKAAAPRLTLDDYLRGRSKGTR